MEGLCSVLVFTARPQCVWLISHQKTANVRSLKVLESWLDWMAGPATEEITCLHWSVLGCSSRPTKNLSSLVVGVPQSAQRAEVLALYHLVTKCNFCTHDGNRGFQLRSHTQDISHIEHPDAWQDIARATCAPDEHYLLLRWMPSYVLDKDMDEATAPVSHSQNDGADAPTRLSPSPVSRA